MGNIRAVKLSRSEIRKLKKEGKPIPRQPSVLAQKRMNLKAAPKKRKIKNGKVILVKKKIIKRSGPKLLFTTIMRAYLRHNGFSKFKKAAHYRRKINLVLFAKKMKKLLKRKSRAARMSIKRKIRENTGKIKQVMINGELVGLGSFFPEGYDEKFKLEYRRYVIKQLIKRGRNTIPLRELIPAKSMLDQYLKGWHYMKMLPLIKRQLF